MIYLSIFWDICLSWSESYCLFLLILPSSSLWLGWSVFGVIFGGFSEVAILCLSCPGFIILN
jgi:hypothetical protein